jgi:hypothetical protein
MVRGALEAEDVVRGRHDGEGGAMDRREQAEPLRFQIAAARTRPQETVDKRRKRRVKPTGVANGPGGWRPDVAGPTGYRYDGATAIGKYNVAGDATAADSAHNNGGPLVGTVDLELLFWGSQWITLGSPSTGDVINAVQRILASAYLSELQQYGFQSITLRGSTIVTKPGPGAPTYSADDVRSMVWDLIDDDVFPEPDDPGGRIIYMVFAPPGSAYDDSGDRGAHTSAHDTDLFDSDYAWVGWSNFGDLDFITDVFTHELVEAISDPQPSDSAWVMNREIHGGNEIGDACNGTADRLDGLLVQAYWSEKDKACVIPWHRYSALLDGSSVVLDTSTIDSGRSLADTGPCQPPAMYQWWVQRHHQQDVWRVTTGGYSQPGYKWTLAGTNISGNGTVSFSTATSHPVAGGSLDATASVTLSFEVHGAELWVTNNPGDGNFSYDVAVEVTDGSGGSSRTTRSFTDSGWMTGQQVVWEDAYYKARGACAAKMKAYGTRMVERILPYIDKGDPPPPWVDNLPAELRGLDRAHVQELEYLAHYVGFEDPGLAEGLRSVASTFGSYSRQ